MARCGRSSGDDERQRGARSTASSGMGRACEREGKLGEGEREGALPFIERGEERESRRGGERESGRPSMVPLGRERGGGGRERVTTVSGVGSERARTSRAQCARARRGRAGA
jgi:hypothetical protein